MSSTNPSMTTNYTIGDFPINTNIDIMSDGVLHGTYLSTPIGYIAFNYSGVYSEQQFESVVSPQ